MPHQTTDARAAAFAGLIDYAGLFPPARLDMSDAVSEYRAARSGAQAWMVDRFICPASRLDELAGVMRSTRVDGEAPWRLTVTADGGAEAIGTDALLIDSFDLEMAGRAVVEAVEALLPASDSAAWIVRTADLLSRRLYFEIPWREGSGLALDSVAAIREGTGRDLGAKLRCGGLTAEAFPPPGSVALVVAGCRDRGLPLKATAGLHHPFRHTDPETGFIRHGFVNLLVACAAADDGVDVATLTEIVADGDPASFVLAADELGWRDHRFAAASIARSRSRLFIGYGSCSFDEPVEDLIALGALPVAP